MTLTIEQSTLDQARRLNAEGDVEGAYRVLSDAGDSYAWWAQGIVAERPSLFGESVRNLWERVDPGSVERAWDTVARQHQSQYLTLIDDNQGRLPNTFDIETSYQQALDDAGVPRTAAIDLLINSTFIPEPGIYGLLPGGGPMLVSENRWDWYEILGIEPERWSSQKIVIDGLGPGYAAYLIAASGLNGMIIEIGLGAPDYPFEIGNPAGDPWGPPLQKFFLDPDMASAQIRGSVPVLVKSAPGYDKFGAPLKNSAEPSREPNPHNPLGRSDEEQLRAQSNLKNFLNWWHRVTQDDDAPKNVQSTKPILLDLDGDGIEITELDRSTVFMDSEGTGLKNRTAWAGSGDGVLFYDADGDGTISDDREYVFTEWDPTATDDLAALRSRFDTNGYGKQQQACNSGPGQSLTLACAAALLLVANPSFGQEVPSIILAPSAFLENQYNFIAEVTEYEPNALGNRFRISFIRVEPEPVSALTVDYVCSMGVTVCNVVYDGDNAFRPTVIFLSSNIVQVSDLCDVEYMISYPAYSYLMRFDWSKADPGIYYFDERRLPPDFTGVEEWRTIESNCGDRE